MFFEARYDSPTAIQPQIGGDVYYDDLYAGSKVGRARELTPISG